MVRAIRRTTKTRFIKIQVISDLQLPIADLLLGLWFWALAWSCFRAPLFSETTSPKAEDQIGNWQLEIGNQFLRLSPDQKLPNEYAESIPS